MRPNKSADINIQKYAFNNFFYIIASLTQGVVNNDLFLHFYDAEFSYQFFPCDIDSKENVCQGGKSVQTRKLF